MLKIERLENTVERQQREIDELFVNVREANRGLRQAVMKEVTYKDLGLLPCATGFGYYVPDDRNAKYRYR